jgi:hypothetical protein
VIFVKELIFVTVGSKVQQTLANLNGVQSSLRTYSLQCISDEEKMVYEKALKSIEAITQDLEFRMKVLEQEEPQYKGN